MITKTLVTQWDGYTISWQEPEKVEVRKSYRILNLGAGVQSTVLALMPKNGEIEPYHFAIFADTGEEPLAVYKHLQWLINEVSDLFPVFIRQKGILGTDLLNGVNKATDGTRFASIPAFTSAIESQPGGLTRRQCTSDYKTAVIERFIRREALGIKPRCRMDKSIELIQYLGLSYEEAGRALRVRARFNDTGFSTPKFPLLEMGMTRRDCERWMERYGVPHKVELSACVFCPYKSNAEWKRLKEENPKGWARAVQIDEGIRMDGACVARGVRDRLYIHRQCVPLAIADLRPKDEKVGQGSIFDSMDAVCDGMCGT